MKKTLNVLGIILSVLLSILLVVLLMVMPLMMSTLSLLRPQVLADAVTQVDVGSAITTIVGEEGAQIDEQHVVLATNLLATPAAEKLIKTYTESVFDALGGKDTQGLTEEQLRQIIDEHNEEIKAAIRESGEEFAAMSDQELQDGIQQMVDENAAEILEMLPNPQTLRQDLVAENPQLELTLDLMAGVNTVKLTLIGIIAALCLVIFLCRFVNQRFMKWLAVDLLIAGLISALVCGAWSVAHELIAGLLGDSAIVGDMVNTLLGSMNTGLILRTVIMLVAAVGLLVGYILLAKNRKKKLTAPVTEPVAEAVAEPAEPAE